ncbi:MAG: CoA transferase [Burkholderiaceae bacterium]
MPGDLHGLRVLDFSQVIAGPFAAQQLAMLGADVIKVEPAAGGDQMRDRMLPSPLTAIGMASPFLTLNVNKRSVAVDLKHPEGKALALRLIATADVMLHNYRAGVIDRLGLHYDAVREVNPRIIYCAISGYGNAGPRSKEAAFDGAIQAASGLMANNGHPGSGPTRTGYFPVDVMTGISAAFAITSALIRRGRTGTGKAIDVSMLDCALTLNASAVAQYLVDDNPGALIGNSSATQQPTADSFETAEGRVLMSAVVHAHVISLCKEMGLSALLDEERFATPAERARHAEPFRAALREGFLSDTADNWVRRLGVLGVPISKVNTVAEAVAEPQLAHREVLIETHVAAPLERTVRLVGSGFMASEDGPAARRPPPYLGEHTRELLAELGYDDAAVAALLEDGVIAEPQELSGEP